MTTMMDAKLMMIQMPRNDCEDPENSTTPLTTTPRSKLNSEGTMYDDQSPNSSSPLGSIPGSNCGSDEMLEHDQPSELGSDSEDDDDDDGENAYREDDYYAFLREMAGSFEATREEDESEVGSDSDGSSDEEEEDQPVGRKRSSTSTSLDDDSGPSLKASPPFEGRGRALGAGSPEEEEFTKASGSVAGQRLPVQSQQPLEGGYPANMAARNGTPLQGRVAPPRIDPPKAEEVSHISRASSDRRTPVVDDYDVVKAVAEFASEHAPLSRLDKQRQELLDAMKLRTDQAANLMAVSRHTHLDPELRSHYVRVRSELLVEARAFEDQLKVIDEAQQQPSASCSQAEAAAQETSFGGLGQFPGVVVK